MKRSLFAFSLLALFFMGFTATTQAQSLAKPAQAPLTPLEAYKQNFTNAVNEGNITMADAHRQKLVSYMEREISAVESGSKAAATPTTLVAKPTKQDEAAAKTAATDLARQKEIATAFRAMDLSTAESVSAAKSKIALIDEFNTISAKRRPATN